jgi:hypothetical protein
MQYQRRILHASENDTMFLENLFDVGWRHAPHRTLRNKTVEVWKQWDVHRPESVREKAKLSEYRH